MKGLIAKAIRYRVLLTFLFFGLQIIWFISGTRITEINDAGLIAWASLLLLVCFWLFLLIDMFKSRIFNRTFWILSMFLMPYLAPAFYLFQRKELKNIRSNRFNRK